MTTIVKATISGLVPLHLWASSLSMGYCSDQDNVALAGKGHFRNSQEKEGWKSIYTRCVTTPRRKHQFYGGAVPNLQKPSQNEYDKIESTEAVLALENNLNQDLLDFPALGSAQKIPMAPSLIFSRTTSWVKR